MIRGLILFVSACVMLSFPADAAMQDQPVVKLRSLDKTTARTMVFEAKVGSTLKFGSIYIRVQACRKAEPIDPPESASFLQIWEATPQGDSKWIFSGWMFASSPALSPMDHPIYDVWVLDCLERRSDEPAPEPAPVAAEDAEKHEGDGEVADESVQPPKSTPPKPRVEMPGEFPGQGFTMDGQE
jgi:hypothetical protein